MVKHKPLVLGCVKEERLKCGRLKRHAEATEYQSNESRLDGWELLWAQEKEGAKIYILKKTILKH